MFDTHNMKVVIMAGGRGTRIATIAPDIPKPMIPIDGVPVLEREILSLKSQGFTDIILTVSHMADVIMHHFGNGRKFGVHIDYYVEKTPLGNAGALFRLRDKLTEDFLLLNADAVFDVDFNRFVAFHKAHGGLVTLFTHPNSHPYDSGLIIADENGVVEKWLAKEDERPTYYKNRVNAGLHVISPKLLNQNIITKDGVITPEELEKGVRRDGTPTPKIDLDRHLLKPLAGIASYAGGKILKEDGEDGENEDNRENKEINRTGKMFCYDSPEYVKDMGTPERYYQVCKDFKEGIVEGKNLKNKQKAVFLDRDGTINKYVGFLRDIEDFELLPGVATAIKKINESGYLAIVVTNQPVIARGEVTFPQLQAIHNKMETLLGKEGAYLDGIYFCPHHPHSGYPGEIPNLKITCQCRKPKPGMLLKAAEAFNIDLCESWMVGDGENDVLAGKAAHTKTALITTKSHSSRAEEKTQPSCGKPTNQDPNNTIKPDELVGSLLDFVEKGLHINNVERELER